MTQYPGTFGSDYVDPNQQPKTSGLAVSALVLSLILCCPITTVIGVLLGAIAFVSIGSNPMRRGRGLAVAAIIVGVLATAGWAVLIYFVAQNYNMVSVAPAEAIRAGYNGDLVRFKAGFGGASTIVSDAEAQAFIESLRSRYGQIQSSKLDWSGFQQMQQAKPGAAQGLPYTLFFDKGMVDATVMLDQRHQTGGTRTIVFDSITIHDAAKGDVTYPPGALPAVRNPSVRSGGNNTAPPPAPAANAPETAPSANPPDNPPGIPPADES